MIQLTKKSLIVAVVSVAFFLEMLDTTIINTAIPDIAAHLGENPVSLKLVLSSYLLSLAVFMPVSGWAADSFGMRRVFIVALSVFLLGSVFSGLSHNLWQLTLSRLLQGLGGAMLVPVGNLIILRTIPKQNAVKAMATISMLSLIGPTLGPLAGGILVTYFSWSWIFFINVPIALLGLWLVMMVMEKDGPTTPQPFDSMGFVLLGVGFSGLLFSLTAIGENLLSIPHIIQLLIIAIVCFIAYVFHFKRCAYPIFDFKLFYIRTFSRTVLGGFWSRMGMASTPFLLPLLYQVVFDRSAIESGLLTLPIALGALCAKPFVKSVLKRFGFRNVLVFGSALLSITIFQFALVSAATSDIWLWIMSFIYGTLSSLHFSCLNSLGYVDVDKKDLSHASSMIRTLQQLSMSFGVALGAIFLHLFAHDFSANIQLTSQILSATFLAMGMTPLFGLFIFRQLQAEDGFVMSAYAAPVKQTN